MKVLSSLTHTPQNDSPLILFAKLNGNYILMANFSKLCKYQPFGLIELHNLSTGQLTEYSGYEKAMFTITRPLNIQF